MSVRALNDFPKYLVRADCGRTMPCENFLYCTKCQKVCSTFRTKKDISFYFNPHKVEVATQNTKRNFGKNPNEKLCPICNIFIKDADYGIESPDGKKTIVSYFKCRYCLWNTLHYNLSYETVGLTKFTSELYRRHKLVREKDMADAITYVQERFNMTNRAISMEENHRLDRQAKIRGFQPSNDKQKEQWDQHKFNDSIH